MHPKTCRLHGISVIFSVMMMMVMTSFSVMYHTFTYVQFQFVLLFMCYSLPFYHIGAWLRDAHNLPNVTLNVFNCRSTTESLWTSHNQICKTASTVSGCNTKGILYLPVIEWYYAGVSSITGQILAVNCPCKLIMYLVEVMSDLWCGE